MGKNLAEFRLLGIDVKVHWSFILILAFGAFVYGAGPAGWLVGGLYGVLTFLLLFVCVTLHEYGHALTARHYGIQTRSILLLPIGGVANLERMPEKPHQEMVISNCRAARQLCHRGAAGAGRLLDRGRGGGGKPGPDQCIERQPARAGPCSTCCSTCS